MGRVYTDTAHVYSSSYSCVFFYTSYTFLFSKLIECCLQGVDRFLSTPYLHLFGIYLHLSERFCDRLRAKYSLFWALFHCLSSFSSRKYCISAFPRRVSACWLFMFIESAKMKSFLLGTNIAHFPHFSKYQSGFQTIRNHFFLQFSATFLPFYGQITLFFPPNTARNTTIFSQNRPKKV